MYPSRQRVLNALKQHGALSIGDVCAHCELSPTAARYHLRALRLEGLIEETAGTHVTAGRPATQYRVTAAAEGQFPKRYRELLHALLDEAQAAGMVETLLESLAIKLGRHLGERLSSRHDDERFDALLEALDYGDMLARLELTSSGAELQAANCLYRDVGARFAPICDLLARIVTETGLFTSQRIECQRDGARLCRFKIVETAAKLGAV